MSSAEDFGSTEDFESEEIGVTLKTSIFMQGIWSVKTFVFVVSFSLSWVIGNTVLLKGVEVILRKLISKWCSSQNPTPTQSFRVKPLEISYQFSQFLQWQRQRSSGPWGIWYLKFPTVAVLCASCPKISYPHNGHIIEGHLCLIMSGCSLGYK